MPDTVGAMERAAKAVFERDPETLDGVAWTWEECVSPNPPRGPHGHAEYLVEVARADARAAILAFLDEGDEAMVSAAAARMHDASNPRTPWANLSESGRRFLRVETRLMLSALRALAQENPNA